MKRIAIFCDGTWNRLSAAHPTNVVKLAEAVDWRDGEGHTQIVYYDEGVGAGDGTFQKLDSWAGGAFGHGLMKNVEEVYRFLAFNYEPGDAIHIFGFSRGAYTARTLGGLLRNCGILQRASARRIGEAMEMYRSRDEADKPDADKAAAFRADFSPQICVSPEDRDWRRRNRPDLAEAPMLEIAYLGIWDTVGALGVPKHMIVQGLFNHRYRFHDAKISSMIRSARHAVAIDERRLIFASSPWDEDKLDLLNGARTGEDAPYQQVWFPGDHGSVGGGGDIAGLSDGALLWVAAGAVQAGLEFAPGSLDGFRPDHRTALSNMSDSGGFKPLQTFTRKKDRTGPQQVTRVSLAARRRWHEPAGTLAEKQTYRPGTLKPLAAALDASPPAP